MTKQSKTPWFQASEHDPVRPGVYLIRSASGIAWWRAFDGQDWFSGVVGLDSPSYEELMTRKQVDFYKLHTRNFEWCGITEEGVTSLTKV
jgi:hypothetical protein